MNVTLPNGNVMQDVPENATRDQVMQRAVQLGLASEQDFLGAAQQTQQQAMSNVQQSLQQPVSQSSVMNQLQSMSDYSKASQQVEELTPEPQKAEKNPSFFQSPELAGDWSFESLKSVAGLSPESKQMWKAQLGAALTGDPKELAGILLKQYPEKFESGEWKFGSPEGTDEIWVKAPSGSYPLNTKGLDIDDLVRFGVDVYTMSPAGRITGATTKSLAKGATVAGGTQAGLQGVESYLGGEFNPEDVALEVAFQGAFQAAEPYAKQFVSTMKEKSKAFLKSLSKKPVQEAIEAETQQIGRDISKRKTKPLMEQIMADSEVVAAAEDLGMIVRPGVYSTNEVYRQLEASLKSLEKNKLTALEHENIKQLGREADNLIREFAGVEDLSELSADFSDRMLSTVRDLESEADEIYKILDENIPPTLRIKPNEAISYIDDLANKMGGMDELSPQLKKIYKTITNPNGVTWFNAEQIRKDLGEAFDNKGKFKDESGNIAKGLYHALRDDGLNVAQATENLLSIMTGEKIPLGDLALEGKKIVSQRKALEESLEGALGKDLGKALMVEMGVGVRGTMKGDTRKIKQVMEAVPLDDREQVATAALNYVFQNGTKSKDFGLNAFVSSYEALMRNKKASNEFMQYVSPEAKKRLRSMYLVSKGLVDANKKDLANPSGTAAQVVGAMNDPKRGFAKLYDVATQSGAGAAVTSPVDAGVVGAAAGAINALRPSKSKVTDAATEMLTNPSFQKAVNQFIQGNKEGAEKILNSMAGTKKWLNAVPPSVKRQVVRQGLMSYLFDESEE